MQVLDDKMFRILPILLFVAAAYCQSNANVHSAQKQTFSSPHTAATQDKTQDSIPSNQADTKATEDNQACTTRDGQVGECVTYYLCNETNSATTDGWGVIDIHFSDDIINCPSSIETCCRISDILPADQPIRPVLPQRKGCGWANPDGVDLRNISATDGTTKFGEFPWVVGVLKIDLMNDNEPEGPTYSLHAGGGSLIHPSVVLTGAHYVAGAKPIKIRAGEWDTQTTKELYPYQERDVASIKIHEDYNKGALFYNIAVLFLAKPVDLAPNVGVACLPPARIPQEEGTRCIATGWGKDKFGEEGRYSTILKKVELPVVSHNKCQASLRTTRLGDLFQLHSSFMCAGGEPGKDTCQGDGGAPLSCPIQNERDRYVQSGIVAWGIGCGGDGIPAVYVDVSNLRDWIDDKMVGKGYDLSTYTY